MPYRFILIPLLALTAVYFWYGLSQDSLNPYMVLIMVVTSVALFIFKHQINDYFYQIKTPEFSEQEKLFLIDRYSFVKNLSSEQQSIFFEELSRACLLHEFIPMNVSKMYEELKWMVLAPAVRLHIFKEKAIWRRYQRTVIYPHPFITPNVQQVHILERDREDGVLILSEEQLRASFWDSNKYLNPSLYLWSQICIEEKAIPETNFDAAALDQFCKLVYNQSADQIRNYFGFMELSTTTLILMACVNHEDQIKIHFESLWNQYHLFINPNSHGANEGRS